jgi:hypothetical protein
LAGKTHGDRILELERPTAAFIERIESLRRDIERVEKDSKAIIVRLQDAERQQLDFTGKRLEEARSRRWDLLKLLLAAVLGGVVTMAAGLVTKVLDRARRGRIRR